MQLREITPMRKITWEEDGEFLYHLQLGLLLALKDKGLLSESQYCHAHIQLQKQRGS